MNSVFFQSWTILAKFYFFSMRLAVFCCCVVDVTSFYTFKSDFNGHNISLHKITCKGFPLHVKNYLMMLATTPAPTVLPPSRIAKRVPSSRAIGLISVTLIFTLSPGITISVPSGKVQEPVTSVVLT